MNEVQSTMLEQLGGRRMLVMTGAQVFTDGDSKLIFKLPRNLSKVRAVTVRYDGGRDTYEVCTLAHGLSAKLGPALTDVYADNLKPLFERLTGLRTSL